MTPDFVRGFAWGMATIYVIGLAALYCVMAFP
jgi:hypothetical protein